MAKMRYREHVSREVLLHPSYCLHVQAMTAEALHGKGEIAEELAWRDMQIEQLRAENEALRKDAEHQRAYKDAAYSERNRLVSLLAKLFPSGKKNTAITGWSEDWHGCVFIDFPWGQASWHYHDSQSHLFDFLPPYQGEWDGHTTEEKYAAIDAAMKEGK